MARRRRRLAAELMRLFLVQVFEHGVFHADPHPGNVFVLPDGRLCYHDFGAIGTLRRQDQEHLRQLFLAVIARDADWLADVYLAMGGVEARIDRAAFVRDLGAALDRYYAAHGGPSSLATILAEFVRLGRRHHVRLVREIALVAKAFMETEALAKRLEPGLDTLASFRDYTSRLVSTLMTPPQLDSAALARGYRSLWTARRAATELPFVLARLRRPARRGRPRDPRPARGARRAGACARVRGEPDRLRPHRGRHRDRRGDRAHGPRRAAHRGAARDRPRGVRARGRARPLVGLARRPIAQERVFRGELRMKGAERPCNGYRG